MTIRQEYRKAINWWLELPWYWQLLGIVPLVAILLLGALSMFTRSPVVEVNTKVDAAIEDLKVHEKTLQDAVTEKQKVIAVQLEAADVSTAEAVERLRTLQEVQTMDELDTLQKEWDL